MEDWFHILGTAAVGDPDVWEGRESRLSRNFFAIMDLLAEADVRATMFFLGWVARKHPSLVKRAWAAGHEIACHGDLHVLADRQTPAEFEADICRAKSVLEDIVGEQVLGYRAPGFSISRRNLWVFDSVAAAGFRYDASVFPSYHGHGGLPGWPLEPHRLRSAAGELVEFPMSVLNVAGLRLCLFGGGYLRLFPASITADAAALVRRRWCGGAGAAALVRRRWCGGNDR